VLEISEKLNDTHAVLPKKIEQGFALFE